jgi:hypothetical protein
VRPGNPWDLTGYRQKLGKSLKDYIWGVSQICHELPKIGDADVISTFLSDTSYGTLVHELDRDQPKTTKELLDIATQHAFSEEAVKAVFVQGDRKVVLGGS